MDMPTLKPDRGVVYVVTGKKYHEEAHISATSIRHAMPEVPIAIFTDGPADRALFDHVIRIAPAPHPFLNKTRYITESPFARTLYLDADTFCIEPFREVFDLLDLFDIALAHAPIRGKAMIDAATREPIPGTDDDMPLSFPEFNCGVIAFRNSGKTRELLSQWHRRFEASLAEPRYFYSDQATLRRLLFAGDLRIATLPPEYNFRFGGPAYAQGPVKLLHGRAAAPGGPAAALARFGAALNATHAPRVYIRSVGIIVRHGPEFIDPGDGTKHGRVGRIDER